MTARGKQFGYARRLETVLRKAHSGAQTSTACTDDHSVKGVINYRVRLGARIDAHWSHS